MAFSFSLYPLIASILASVYFLSWTEATKNGGITLDLIHRDSPLSPYYNPSKTHFERLQNRLKRSASRKSTLFSASKSELEAPVSPVGGEYLMKIGIGTPPVDILGFADTGSDLTWTQCQPCRTCFDQNTPLFDPTKTSTYRAISCQSKECSEIQLGTPSCDSNNTCTYQYRYGDSSHAIGDLSADTLTFSSGVSFRDVVFGCGRDNAGTFHAGSGIIGLGGGQLSIINQLTQSIGGRFSYCLTGPNGTSKISFGANVIVTGQNVVSTPLVRKEPSTYYHLTLEGFSIGGKRVATNVSVEQGNVVIDSGTTFTHLPLSLYEGVESAMAEAVKGNHVSDPTGEFKLCYEAIDPAMVPPVIAHFTGADVELTQGNMFSEVAKGVVCLTLLPTYGLGIFGNMHQMNYEIGYDLVEQKLSFLRKDCSIP